MICYSYYANGDTKYIDQLLERAKDSEERIDLGKFMIGSNALWKLTKIRAEDEKIKQYLETLPDNKYAVTAVKRRAYDLKNDELRILKEQKDNKIW